MSHTMTHHPRMATSTSPLRLSLVALSLLSGTTWAQSNVTLYGVVDLGLAKATGGSTQMVGSSTPNNGTSRWGLRGSEDLGHGHKVGFQLESQIDPRSGATPAAAFARGAFVTLSGPWGSLKAGRSLTPSYHGVLAWELTGSANYTVVNSQFGYNGLNSRHDAELSYTTPTWQGVQATVGRVLAANNGNLGKTDLNIIYRQGPWSAGVSYNKVEGRAHNAALGVAYQFSGAKVAASWQDARGGKLGKGYTVGAQIPVGPVQVTLDLARDTLNHDTDHVLEVRYPLSKRTMVYAAHIHNGAGKAARTVDTRVVGLRHNF